MKITYVHQYFKTPNDSGAIRSYYIAKALVDAGNEVHMITSHNSGATLQKEIDGIKVTYLPVYYHQNLSPKRRVLSFYKFYKKATKYILSQKRPDLLYITSTPLLVGLVGIKLKRKLNLPFIFEIRDLWPKVPIELGYIKFGWIKRRLYRLEHKIYQEAKALIGLSPVTTRYVEGLGIRTPYYEIPNMSNCKIIPKDKNLSPILNIGYLGAFGKANHVGYLIDVAKKALENQLPLHFHFAGSGAEYDTLEKSTHYGNVTFHGNFSHEKLSEIFDKIDVTYTSFLNHASLEGNSPNKFFDSLAAGKLTIVNTKGWLKQLVEENNCGFYHDPTSPDDFIDQINQYLNNPSELFEAQKNARLLAESTFNKVDLCNQVIDVITHLDDNVNH